MIISVKGSNVPLCYQQFLYLIADMPIFRIHSLLIGKDLGVFCTQVFNFGDLFYAKFIESFLCRFVKSNSLPVFLQEAFAVTGPAIFFIDSSGLRVVDDVFFQNANLDESCFCFLDIGKQSITLGNTGGSCSIKIFNRVQAFISEKEKCL